jgi:hypothetical protein
MIIILLAFALSEASVFLDINNRNFEPSEFYDDDIYIGGNTVRFQAGITGDLTGGSRELVFSGDCDGNINWAAQWVTVSGTVKNSVRAFAYSIDINANIGRNLIAGAQSIQIGPDSRIVKDALVFGDEISFEGYVGENLTIQGESVILAGKIDGDVRVETREFEIRPNTVIAGDLVYVAPEQIKIPDSVEIIGQTEWIEKDRDKDESDYRAFMPIIFSIIMFIVISVFYYLWVFIWLLLFGNTWVIIITFIALIISGIVIVSLNKNLAHRSVTVLEKRFFPALGLGILTIILFPLASLIAFISFIGWPLGFILLFAFGTFGFAGAIYAAQFLGCFVGRLLNLGKKRLSFVTLIIGILLIALLTLIPIFGWIIFAVAVAAGLGALILSLEKFKDKNLFPDNPPQEDG